MFDEIVTGFFFFSVTDEHIVAAFPELEIKHVNIIKAAGGKSRGFGYVLLQSEVSRFFFEDI